MNCFDFNKLLDNYENLSSNELDELSNHAQSCESCKGELEFYKSIMLTAASLPVPEPPVDLIERVNSRIDSIPKYKSGFDKVINNLRYNTKQYASIAACIAVGVVVGLNSKSISNMLHPQPENVQVIPVVDVADTNEGADADSAAQDTDDALVADDTSVVESPSVLPSALPDIRAKKPVSTAAPKERKTASTPVAAEKKAESSPAATDKVTAPKSTPGRVQTKPAAASSDSTVTANAGNTAADPAVPEPVQETERSVQEPIAATPTPANTKTSKYTIARENYHIPTPSNETAVIVTEVPKEAIHETPSERYQIAMGNYEISEEEKKTIKNKLIVSESDMDEITACMNKAGIRGTSYGCEASVSAFNSFLAMLDAKGIYYSYAQVSPSGEVVSFNLLAN